MRRRAVGAIVGATVAVIGVAAYVVADAHDWVPGVLTLSDAPQPSPAPTLVPQSGAQVAMAQSGAGTPVTADQVDTLWQPVAEAARDGKWKTWGMVMDADTGDVLLDSGASTAHTPASITKVLTGVTALSHLDASATLATGTSLAGSDLYLWGQGDLMLARGAGDADAVDGHAGVGDLAAATVAALRLQDIDHVTLRWNHDIFTGASHLSAWDKQGSGNYEGEVGAFAIDTGRTSPDAYEFFEDPGRDVALELAAALRESGVEVDVIGESAVPTGATEVARVESATIGQQVRWMLHHSDNTLADQYCRLAAAAAGAETSYTGATSTVVATLKGLKVDTTGLRLEDCSGLSTSDRIAGRTLVGALDASMGSSSPDLRDLVRSLPWGGLDGTLEDRFTTGPAAADVQAKTGSLPVVASLAGVVQTSGGRTLVFALGNDAVPDDGAYWTRSPLDAFVQGLAGL